MLIYHDLFSISPIDGHLDYFHSFAIKTCATVNSFVLFVFFLFLASFALEDS